MWYVSAVARTNLYGIIFVGRNEARLWMRLKLKAAFGHPFKHVPQNSGMNAQNILVLT